MSRPLARNGGLLPAALLLVATIFAVAAGANDGGSMLAGSLQVSAFAPRTAWLMIVGAVAVGPMLLGTGVAHTLARGLVPFSGPSTDAAFIVAVVTAMLVVFVLTRAGVSTSLTLAVVGGVTGAGIGYGMHVDATRVGEVVALGLVAPVAAAGLAFGVSRIVLPALHAQQIGRSLRRVHAVTFGTQCLAYSANGGQKVLALLVVATGRAASGRASLPRADIAAIALPFGLGVLLGMRKVSAGLGRGVLAVRLRHTVAAEVSATVLALGSGLAGVPLTMSQSVAGALVGAGASEGVHRVRWSAATRFVSAWLLTVPVAVVVAALGAAALRRA